MHSRGTNGIFKWWVLYLPKDRNHLLPVLNYPLNFSKFDCFENPSLNIDGFYETHQNLHTLLCYFFISLCENSPTHPNHNILWSWTLSSSNHLYICVNWPSWGLTSHLRFPIQYLIREIDQPPGMPPFFYDICWPLELSKGDSVRCWRV